MSFVNGENIGMKPGQLAIGITHSPLGSHIGIIFHSLEDKLQLFHLMFHKKASVDGFPTSECWIARIVEIPDPAAKHVVAFIRNVSTYLPNLNEIAYGINFKAAKGSFDVQGHYTPQPESDGLTCATFVVEVLRAAGIVLIKEDWEDRPENIDWGHQVCAMLEKHKLAYHISDDHIALVRSNINGLRIRPEEVAFSSSRAPKEWPVSFKLAYPESPKVISNLHAICPLSEKVNEEVTISVMTPEVDSVAESSQTLI